MRVRLCRFLTETDRVSLIPSPAALRRPTFCTKHKIGVEAIVCCFIFILQASRIALTVDKTIATTPSIISQHAFRKRHDII